MGFWNLQEFRDDNGDKEVINMSVHVYYAPVCKYCGKKGNQRVAGGPVGSGKKPTAQAKIPGKCPNSPGGVHAPFWEEA